MCKRLKLDYTNKWYLHMPESVPKTEKHKILWDLIIEMDHSIMPRRSDLVLTNKKKTCHQVDFTAPAKHSENERKQKDRQILGSCQRAEKAMEYEGDSDTNNSWGIRNSSQELRKEIHSLEKRFKSRIYRPQHCWNQLEYWEESWKPEETCCHSDSSEGSPANDAMKNSQGVTW